MLRITLHLLAIAALMASGTAFGQPNDFAEQLMYSNEQQFMHIFPIGVDNSKLIEKIKRSVHLLTAAIERKLPPDTTDEAKEELAKQQANAAVVLLRIYQPTRVWPLLKHSPDPRARSYLIHRLGPLGVDAKIIIKRLNDEPDITIRRALVLSLGEFDEKGLSLDDRMSLVPKLQEMYRTDADPGLHSAVEWLLRQWKQEDWLKQVNEEWAKDKEQREKKLESIQMLLSNDKEKTPPQWYINGQSQTMVAIPGPVEFMMGSPEMEAERYGNETQHRKRIERSFSIASKEVTAEQFLRFRNDHDFDQRFAPTDDCPVNNVSWYEAVKYCNWLNDQEGIANDQSCYEITGHGTKLRLNYLSLSGYRLPTEAEMEYVTRAGATTARYYGETEELLEKYGWHLKNSERRTWPVGSLKPNDLGLFDIHGNVYKWCQDSFEPYPTGVGNGAVEDHGGNLMIESTNRVLRGGSFIHLPHLFRSASRGINFPPETSTCIVGFRLARTIVVRHSDLPTPNGG